MPHSFILNVDKQNIVSATLDISKDEEKTVLSNINNLFSGLKFFSQKSSNNRPLRKLADACEIRHQAGAENQSVHLVHEDSSTALMSNFAEAVEFPKRSNKNNRQVCIPGVNLPEQLSCIAAKIL